MRTIGIIVCGILGLAAIIGGGIALDLGGLIYQEKTAGIRGHSEAERLIESAPSRIQHYNEFFALCSDIQAKESAIDALRANQSLADDMRGGAITAHEISRQGLIAKYNAKAGSSYTAARFKDSKLPFHIADDPYAPGGSKTNCAG